MKSIIRRSSLYLAAALMTLVFIAGFTGCSSDNVPGGNTAKPEAEIRAQVDDRIKHQAKGFDYHFDKGLQLLKNKMYRQAAGQFEKAADFKPDHLHNRYYLMVCYSHIEDRPYSADSKTVDNALKVVTLAPDTEMGARAKGLLKANEKALAAKEKEKKKPEKTAGKTESKETPTPVKKEKDKGPKLVNVLPPDDGKKAKVSKKGESKPSVIVMNGNDFYPKAAPQSTPKRKRKVRYPEDVMGKPMDEDEAPTDKIVLKGLVSRPNEKNRTFNPQGMKLWLISLQGSQQYTTVTDSKGNYKFNNVDPAGTYVLIGVSRYQYTRNVREYVRPYGPIYRRRRRKRPPPGYDRFDRPYDGVHYDSRIEKKEFTGGAKGRITFKEKNDGKIGIGPFERQPTRIPTGDGFIYYPPNFRYYDGYPYRYYDYDYERPVEQSLDMSWHLRMNLNEPGVYVVNLDEGNADDKFLPEVKPDYDPITLKPYSQLTDVKPEKAGKGKDGGGY